MIIKIRKINNEKKNLKWREKSKMKSKTNFKFIEH